MRETVDLYWSFRSPYSYLLTRRLRDAADEIGFDVAVRVVLPLAVRRPEFFDQVNPLWPRYLMRDVKRLAEYHGISYRWPRPDPVVQDVKAGVIPKEQPFIWRLSRLGVVASEMGRGLPFLDEASRVIWDGSTTDWHEGSHLAEAADRAGLAFDEMEAAVAERSDELDATLARNQDALEAVGHWGVPTMVLDDEPFFGQDRLELLVWRLRQRRGEAIPQD